MRTSTILIMLFLCLHLSGMAGAQALTQKVSLEYRNQSVQHILNQIGRKYNVRFSYANNYIPLSRKATLSVQNKTLAEALNILFEGSGIGYEEVGSQIVLKKAAEKPGQKAPVPAAGRQMSSTQLHKMPLRQLPPNALASNDRTPLLTAPDFRAILRDDTLTREKLYKQYTIEKRKLRNSYYTKLDSLDRSGDRKTKSDLRVQFRNILHTLESDLGTLADSLNSVKLPRVQPAAAGDRVQQPQPAVKQADSSGYFYSPAQVTFINPISTNGAEASRTVNGVSLNFAGHSAALEGFEAGLLLNSEGDYVRGVQLSGFGNYVRNSMSGVQASGFFNINGGETHGAQLAGFTNIAAGDVYAYQGAGFMNIAAGKMRGVQSAGFLNVVTDSLKGAQLSGFLNVAKTVKGSQIGFLNVADTVSGVQIGFLSIAKRGYRRLELSGNETFYGNLAFKTGTRKFYNIFTAGIRPDSSVITWGYGYGFGSEFLLSRRLTLSLDAMAYQVHRDGLQGDELNLLCQFKPTFGVLLSKKASLFAGPTVNVMVSNTDRYRTLDNPATGSYHSSLAPDWYFDSYTSSRSNTNTTIWVGFNGGIRF